MDGKLENSARDELRLGDDSNSGNGVIRRQEFFLLSERLELKSEIDCNSSPYQEEKNDDVPKPLGKVVPLSGEEFFHRPNFIFSFDASVLKIADLGCRDLSALP